MDVKEGHPERLLEASQGIIRLVRQEHLPLFLSRQVHVLEKEVRQQILRHCHPLGQLGKVRPALGTVPQVLVDALAALPVGPVKEVIKGLRFLQDGDLLDLLQTAQHLLVAIDVPELLVGKEILANTPGFIMKVVHEPLREATLFLFQTLLAEYL